MDFFIFWVRSSGWPLWVEYMTIISHWLLILNSSCNFAIYLHKDPKFKAVLKEMFLSKLSPRMRNAIELSIGQDGDNEMKALTPDSRNRVRKSILGNDLMNDDSLWKIFVEWKYETQFIQTRKYEPY